MRAVPSVRFGLVGVVWLSGGFLGRVCSEDVIRLRVYLHWIFVQKGRSLLCTVT